MMKLFGRRKTFAVAAGAPLAMAAGMNAKNYGLDSVSTTPPPYWNTTGGAEIKHAAVPPKWRDFCDARDAFHKQRTLQHEVHNTHVFDLNIQALRSVSTQHKARMQIESQRRAQREAESLLESIARQLNVWDFWKGSKKQHYDDYVGQQDAASNRY